MGYLHRAVAETQPLQDAFAVLVFVSVGMLFDPGRRLAARRTSVRPPRRGAKRR